jgi:FeS assembly SUF system protein
MSDLHDRIVEAVRTVFDPEIPVNVYDLGLIYDIDIADDGAVAVKMTLTSPNCPEAERIPPEVEGKVASVDGVSSASVELVWTPPWGPERMSEAAMLELGL